MLEFDGSKKLMSQVKGSQAGGIQKQNYSEKGQPFCPIQAFN